MSIVLALRALAGRFLAEPVRGPVIALLLAIGLLAWLNASKADQIAGLKSWQGDVLDAVAHAVDQRDAKGALLPVKAKDAVSHILNLGRFRTDAQAAKAKAAADDAAHALGVARQDEGINRKASDDYASRIASARAEAERLRVDQHPMDDAGRLRPAGGATASAGGGRGTADLSGLSAAGGGAAASAGADGLPASADQGTPALICAPLDIDERLLATEQALQLDALIGAIEDFAKVQR